MLSGLPKDSELYGRLPLGYGGRFYGVYPALVSDVVDPDGQGRVQVQLPWCPDPGGEGSFQVWARLATLMGGGKRGSWFIPDKNDEVLVCFEGGDTRRPYVIGGLWNGQDAAPEAMDQDGKNDIKSITSRDGVKITLDDTDKKEALVLLTPAGHKVTLQDDGDNSFIKVEDKSGNSIFTNKDGIIIKDKHANTTTKNKDGIVIKDTNGMTITQSKDGIKLEDPTHKTTARLSGATVELEDGQKDNIRLSGGNLDLKSGLGTASVKIAPQEVTASASPASKVTVGAGNVLAQFGVSSIKLEAAGITCMCGPTILKVGADGVNITALKVSITAPMVQVSAPMFQVTAAMAQFSGVVQCATLMTSSVVSGAYTPGGGNIL